MSTQKLKIRKFEQSDYPEIVRLESMVFPDRKRDEESLRFNDNNKAEKCEHQRYIAEVKDRVVGHGYYTQLAWSYAPGKYFIYGCIDPDFQGKGYGSEFYRFLMDKLEEKDPKKLETYTREDKKRSRRYLEDRGFYEIEREWELVLEIEDFDFKEFRGLEERVSEEHDIVLKSLGQIKFDEKNKKKLHELYEEINEDLPIAVEYTGIDFDQFIKFFDRPDFFLEGYIIAVKDGEYIGLSSHLQREKEEALYTNLTGVKRGYRGKGIATAMKVKAIETALEKGIPKVKTSNETENEAMLHINEKLGFQKKPAWISYEKVLKK